MTDIFGAELIARQWWAVLLRGIAALALGIIAFQLPQMTLATLVVLLAAYLIVNGVFSFVAVLRAMSHHQRWWSLVAEAVFDLAAAAFVLVWPNPSVMALVGILAVWAIATGVTALMVATFLPYTHGRTFEAISGAISIGLGISMIAMPGLGAVALDFWIALYAVTVGVLQVILAFKLQSRHSGVRSGTMAAI
jgi:uncharacterized membrane protein HdeD (DUF308 family)